MASPSAETSSPIASFFSPDSPSRPELLMDQVKFSCQALSVLKEKLQKPNLIAEEFAKLQANRIPQYEIGRACSIAVNQVNREKNRYQDVVPFDRNRVILSPCKDYRPAAKGYINASFISTSSSENITRFIATQGPLPHTYEDFWEMVIQNRCPVIVMITRLVDNYKILKCGDYFQAEDGPREFGNISIVSNWIRTLSSSLVLRNLEINYKESVEPPVSVLHIQYPEWPDHGVPKDTSAVRRIFRRIYNVPPQQGPVIVHCSAGIGRTGTYCTIHNTIQRILNGDNSAVDIASTVAVLRSQRIGMVQTMEQYQFCYRAIIAELEDLVKNNTPLAK